MQQESLHPYRESLHPQQESLHPVSGRQRSPRPRKRQTLLGSAPLLICILVIGVVYLLTGCFGLNKDKAENTAPPTLPTEATNEVPRPPETAEPSETEPSETEAPSESGTEPTETETEPVETEPAGPVMTTVDSSYFSDALFVGDSRTDGLRLYGSVGGGADYYCGTSMTIFGVLDSNETTNGVTGFQNVLQAKQYGKVYIMFGINECGYDTDYFLQWYGSVVEHIRYYQPDAIIYVQSICYVTQKKENAQSVFSTANLKEKNAGIAELANGKDIFYLEVNDALNDGTDHLPSDYTNDGVHLKPDYYALWRDYLYSHAIVDEKHPWSAPAETGGAD